MSLFDMFAGNVAADPDKEIIVDEQRSLSRAGLMEESGRVAAWLLAQNVSRETIVAVNLTRGVAVVSCLVGIWRAGACAMVVTADAPLETQRFFLDDAQPDIVLNGAALGNAMSCEPLEDWREPEAHDAALIVYSSSSTGRPKGIVHEYGSFKNIGDYLERFRLLGDFSYERIGLTGGDYDISFLYTVAYTLCVGATLCIVPTMKLDGDEEAIYRFLEERRVTTTGAIAGIADERILARIPTMEYLQVGGDVSLCGNTCPLPLLNCYGASECFGMLTYGWVSPGRGVATAGYSTGMFRIFLLDSAGNPVCEVRSDGGSGCLLAAAETSDERVHTDAAKELYPIDGLGEIAVDAPYFRGYLHNPDGTARATRGGLYHTGDMGRVDEEGRLTVLGRMAEFVFTPEGWIVPSYVHEALSEPLSGRVYAVLAFEGNGKALSPRPAVCVFYEGEPLLDEDCMRIVHDMTSELPAYMHPTHWVRLGALPRLTSGKLNRAKLAAVFCQESR